MSDTGLVGTLATTQRILAVALHQAVGAASGNGATWRDLGDAAGMTAGTLYRQYHGGDVIVVARARHARRKPRPGAEDQ